MTARRPLKRKLFLVTEEREAVARALWAREVPVARRLAEALNNRAPFFTATLGEWRQLLPELVAVRAAAEAEPSTTAHRLRGAAYLEGVARLVTGTTPAGGADG